MPVRSNLHTRGIAISAWCIIFSHPLGAYIQCPFRDLILTRVEPVIFFQSRIYCAYITFLLVVPSDYCYLIMRLPLYSLLGLLGLSNLVLGKALDNVFKVKKGTTLGGCDNYRTGQVNANLDAYFEEAQTIIKTASDAFGKYNTDVQVQKIAKSFFGITPNAKQDGPATTEDGNLLKHVQSEWRERIISLACLFRYPLLTMNLQLGS